MEQAKVVEAEAERPESNVDLARYRKLDAAARAARAASSAAQKLVSDERDALSRLMTSWRGHLHGMDPHKLELADALINPDVDRVLHKKALNSGVGRRFPYGLADQILASRAKLAAIEAEAQPATERAQHLGELSDSLTEYLRELGMVKPDDSAPVVGDGAGGGASPAALARFAGASKQPEIFRKNF